MVICKHIISIKSLQLTTIFKISVGLGTGKTVEALRKCMTDAAHADMAARVIFILNLHDQIHYELPRK